MPPDEKIVDDLVAAILDGTRIDWAAAGSAPTPVIEQLRVLAAVAALHRAIPAPNGGDLPASWGHLRLIERIGRGSFGEVYRAWDARLDREVALKLLPAGAPDSDPRASSFIQEGRLLARVRHPNVVTIYGAEQIGDRIGLWMEFVPGRTLEQILRETNVVSVTDAIRIGLELCHAVSAVHGAGLLHRDIKTDNVMRAEDGRVVLMDFGTGRELADDASSDLAGTPLYLAPEVFDGQHATVESDVYSLGVLIYRLVTGAYPVHAPSVREVRGAHARGERTAVRAARRGVPRGLVRIIDRAIHPDPTRRYQSVEALGADLLALTPHSGSARIVAGTACAAALLLAVAAGWDGVSPVRVASEDRRAGAEPRRRDHRRASASPHAYELYLQGQALVERRGVPNALKAAELFRRVISSDPGFAPAHAGLATASAFTSFPYRGLPYETAYPVMRQAALEALRRDPLLAEAYAAMGWVHSYEREWARAEISFRRSIELDPTLTHAYTSYSLSTLQPLKKHDEALRLLQVAAHHDPHSLDVQREIGQVQLFAGRYGDAVQTFQRVSEIEPDFPFVATYLARALMLAGRAREAFPLLEPGLPYLGLAYVMTGRRAEAERLAAESERYPFRLAVVSAALGDTERAIGALERAAAVEPHRMGRLLIEPEMAALSGDPRVSALRKRFGLP